MHDAPIYAQLISERGDIPLQVREEARRIRHELDRVLNWGPPSDGLPHGSSAAPSRGSGARQHGSGPDEWF
ncbi:hypothetical protein ACWERY_05940 [Streptomyces sp. NPDC004082]|uniref:hypothetical protein n=1 Tax=Streptomyces sp. NPDC005481 TaxID=3154881 RepID=UPI0033B82FB0